MFSIAHISDLHIPPLPRLQLNQLASKRLLGLFSWHHKWKSEHRQAILDALFAKLDEIKPDHICITGDITFTTDPAEVDQAVEWLARLGDPTRVSLIPGNHDAYVPGALDYALRQWSCWIQDDEGQQGFPYLHRRGPVNIIGLSSAVVTPPLTSMGYLGNEQLEKTKALLGRINSERRTTLLLLHHAPHDGATGKSRALSNRRNLQAMLFHAPVELILHGHLHYPVRATLDSVNGPIPVLGAASASARGKHKAVAHFHLIELETDAERPQLAVQHYHYVPESDRFVATTRELIERKGL